MFNELEGDGMLNMRLTYLGKNKHNLDEWLIEETQEVILSMQKEQVELMVTQLEIDLERELSDVELRHITWLCNQDQQSFKTFMKIFKDLSEK